MKFDKSIYRRVKKIVIEKIKQTHNWEVDEGFIADGIICPDTYNNEDLKVLVILAETYGYSDNGDFVDIESQLKDDFMGIGDQDVQSPRKIAALLWLLLESIEKKQKVPLETFRGIFKMGNYILV